MLTVVPGDGSAHEAGKDSLSLIGEVVREGARRMLAGALQAEVTVPRVNLDGLSSGDFVPALSQFPGSAAGLPAAVITRLTGTWKAEQRVFAARDLSAVDYACLWAGAEHREAAA